MSEDGIKGPKKPGKVAPSSKVTPVQPSEAAEAARPAQPPSAADAAQSLLALDAASLEAVLEIRDQFIAGKLTQEQAFSAAVRGLVASRTDDSLDEQVRTRFARALEHVLSTDPSAGRRLRSLLDLP